MALISCTTVLTLPYPRGGLKSHTFLNIPIHNEFLGKWGGVYSVLIGTILSLLQQQLLTESGMLADLASIINGVDSETITIATTHILFFRRDLQDLVHGYHSLDTLSSINIQMEVPFHPVIQLNCELLAVQLGKNSTTKLFVSTWAPCGPILKTHFIVIFSHLSHDNSQTLSHGIGVPLGYGSCHSAVSNQPAQPLIGMPVTVEWLWGLANASNNMS